MWKITCQAIYPAEKSPVTYGLSISIVFFLVILGCVAPFSKGMRKQVDRSVTFSMLLSDPERYKDKIVILGGEVIATSPLENNTEVEILEKPLGWDWRPQTEGAQGRFILEVNKFLDPMVWKQGREVTVLAKVAGQKEGKIGEKAYIYPVLEAIEWRLWVPMPSTGYYYGPFWDPFFIGPSRYPHNEPPIIIVPDKH